MCDRAAWIQGLEELGDRIRLGIDVSGMHLLTGQELALIWESRTDVSPLEKRMHIENYALHEGLVVHLNEDATVAVFRKFQP